MGCISSRYHQLIVGKAKAADYILLGILLFISACKCTKPSDQPVTMKSFTLLLCSANVHSFSDHTPEGILTTLDALRQEGDDVVVFGLQETSLKSIAVIKKNLPQYQVYDYRGNHYDMANTLLIYTKARLEVQHSGIDLPLYHTQRFATVIQLPAVDFKVVNTHLVGGRYDDQKWPSFVQGREEQLRTILAYQPTIIMGDFNADDHQRGELTRYWKTLLQNAVGQDEKAIIAYKTNGHAYLSKQGYLSLLDRSAMEPTTPFGEVVDWIYASPKLAYAIIDRGLIKSIDQGLSDHNFPWVRIRIEQP